MKYRILTLATVTALASCSAPTPPPVPKPAEPPKIVVPQPATQEPLGPWIDWPITAGDWVYRQDERGSLALFGETGRDAIVTLRCDRQQGRIYLSRASAQSSANFTLRSSSTLKQVAARTTGGTPSYVAAELMPGDIILDSIAYSRGRFALESTGEQSLAIPVWAEFSRVVEDCR